MYSFVFKHRKAPVSRLVISVIIANNSLTLIVGDVTSMATIPVDMEVEANFLAKEDGIIAGIALADLVFHEVDPSLKVWMHCTVQVVYLSSLHAWPFLIYILFQVEWSQKDGDYIHKGLQFGKVFG